MSKVVIAASNVWKRHDDEMDLRRSASTSGSQPEPTRHPMVAEQVRPLPFGGAEISSVRPQLNEAEASELLSSLERICASTAFQGTRRCQQFLRYVVNEALAGRSEELKERTIATEVFGKGLDFEPGEDALVRVKAREVRKRLEGYYESSPAERYRIEIPSGGYAPLFLKLAPLEESEAAVCESDRTSDSIALPTVESQPKRWSRRQMLLGASALVGGVGVVATIWDSLVSANDNLSRLWKPVFRSGSPLVIFIPVLKDRTTGEISDRVGIGPVQALQKTEQYLDQRHHRYHLRFGSDLNFGLLKEQPSLLLGGFSSEWTQRMTEDLRFTMRWDTKFDKRSITDSVTGKSWYSDQPTPNGYANGDYGLLTRLFDRETGQIVMVAGGLTTFGTEAAAAVLTDSASFAQVVDKAPHDWDQRNFQVLVRIIIVGTTPSRPEITAVHFW